MADESTQFILGDAAIDAVTGKHPRRGLFRRKKKPKRETHALTHCENCGATLTGEYCAQCGQHAIDYRRSLTAVLVDAADSFFNWDTKFLKSLGVLLVKPWKLTNDFNAGRRARYVHPLRLYLLGSITFFLIAKLVNLAPSGPSDLKPEDRAEVAATLANMSGPGSIFNEKQRAKIETARAKLLEQGALSSGDRRDLIGSLKTPENASLPKETRRKQRAELAEALARIPRLTRSEITDPGFIGPLPEGVKRAAPNEKNDDSLHFTMGGENNQDKVQSPFEKWMETRIKERIGENGTRSKLFLETLRSNIPTMMLCCIPLFAFILKILYVRQRRYYIEHLVYALHIHTFAYVATVVIALIAMGAERWFPGLRGLLIGLLCTATVVQVFLSIRRVYRQGWFFTTFKFFLGGFVYLMILIIAVGTTAFVTLLLPN